MKLFAAMNHTLLRHCRVPWQISPSSGGLTLRYSETDVEPECTVTLGGGRIQETGSTDGRAIEITFDLCWFARAGHHFDTESISSLGYSIESLPGEPKGGPDWYAFYKEEQQRWLTSGICRRSGFYIAERSAWLEGLPDIYRDNAKHYVLDGRDGYVEVIARGFYWKEWTWQSEHRDSAMTRAPVVEEKGVD